MESFIVRFFIKMFDGEMTKKVYSTEDGKIILKPSIIFKVVGIMSLIVSLIIAIFMLITGSLFDEDFIYSFILFAMFFFPGLLFLIYARNAKIEADSEKIIYTGFTGKSKEIKWIEIKSISFNNSTNYLILKSANTKIKFDIHLKGMRNLISIIKENVDISIYGQAIEKIGARYKSLK